jgi:hypothetical protein
MGSLNKIEMLEAEINNLAQTDCPIRHHFAPGVYAREISIPKGTVLTGAIHKIENLAILSLGKLRLVTDDGTVEISAPYILTVKAGQKNAAFALEDSVWTNFFATTEIDTDKLVEIFSESKACELIGGKNNIQLISIKNKELEN